MAEQIGKRGIRCVVIDTEHEQFNRGLARQVAEAARGEYYRLTELRAQTLARTVREYLPAEGTSGSPGQSRSAGKGWAATTTGGIGAHE